MVKSPTPFSAGARPRASSGSNPLPSSATRKSTRSSRCRALTVTSLASGVHPMVLQPGDPGAATSIAAALAERGLSEAAVRDASSMGDIVRYEPARGLRAQAPLKAEDLDLDVIALSGTGLAPPRRLRCRICE